jgi:glycosyltransferase involved in cell wall biosynthesis
MPTVAILQRILPDYRIAFFRQLHQELALYGIDLKLFYGQERLGTVPRTVDLAAPWAVRVENRYWPFGGQEFVWQPVHRYLSDIDALIVEQANRLLINHYLILRRTLHTGPRLAYWGHGENLQAESSNSASERLKRRLLCQVDWWFAYTVLSAEIAAKAGFKRERITTVQNTIDLREFLEAKETLTGDATVSLKAGLGIKTTNVCLYCGGIYPDKRIPFLLEACSKIKLRVPDFEMIIVGDGPDRHLVEAAAEIRPWLHYVGPKHGADRVPYFVVSKALLMPGLVGLAVVDSFAAATPLFTTAIHKHSPEIAYLVNGVNGVITPDSADAYATAVAEYLRSESLQTRLQRGCLESVDKYSLETMTNNFARGIRDWLIDL